MTDRVMRQRLLILTSTMAVGLSACGLGKESGAPVSSGAGGTAGAPGDTGPAFDPDTVSGEVTLAMPASSPAGTAALNAALDGFKAAYPSIKVTPTIISGDYRAQMQSRFGTGTVPDVVYVNAAYAPEWMREGFLLGLDGYIAGQAFDTTSFFPGYLDVYKQDGETLALPRDGSTIAMALNTDLVATPPTTLDELVSVATRLKGNRALKAPMCLDASLEEGLAFVYAQGGSLLSDDGNAAAIDTGPSKAAVQWYLDLFRNGLAVRALAGESCGGMLGKGQVAVVFGGGSLKGAVDASPHLNWTFAELPTGSIGDNVTVSDSTAYGIAVDSVNQDQAWVLLQYLAGPDGMELWTRDGVALPSRSDVPVPAGYEVIVASGDYARPGSGSMPDYVGVVSAFDGAFRKELAARTYRADPVVAATRSKILQVLATT